LRRRPVPIAQANAAVAEQDMPNPPGNPLHRLTADRTGQWPVKANDQLRICFIRGAASPEQVEFVDDRRRIER